MTLNNLHKVLRQVRVRTVNLRDFYIWMAPDLEWLSFLILTLSCCESGKHLIETLLQIISLASNMWNDTLMLLGNEMQLPVSHVTTRGNS
jgi:hypothetical protein